MVVINLLLELGAMRDIGQHWIVDDFLMGDIWVEWWSKKEKRRGSE